MLSAAALHADAMTDDQLRAAMHQMAVAFRDNAPTSAAQAATTILEGVRTDTCCVLVEQDAQALDRLVRETPELAMSRRSRQGAERSGTHSPPRSERASMRLAF